MQGRIYISGAFTKLKYNKCNPNKNWLDNDPHFWSTPPTWGICRPDLRKMLNEGDYVFFILPKLSPEPQMIYGYMKIQKVCTHEVAYNLLPEKRMGNYNPNGNIIVTEDGKYNPYDLNAHKHNFEKIKKHYVIGDTANSKFLSVEQIKRLSPEFITTLQRVFKSKGKSVIEIISRKGKVMKDYQITELLNWLK